MLVLILNQGGKVSVGEAVIHIIKTHKGSVKLGIEAPADIDILRDNAIKKEPRKDN
jgi:sRNA-binding carbon storage regulator CsrA